MKGRRLSGPRGIPPWAEMRWPSSHPGLRGQQGGRQLGRLQRAAPGVLGGHPALDLLSATHLLPDQGPGRGGRRAGPSGAGRCACRAQVLLHRCWTQEHHPQAPHRTLPSKGLAALCTDSKPTRSSSAFETWGQGPSAFNRLLVPSSGDCVASAYGDREKTQLAMPM